MKIAAAQLNYHVGNLSYNSAKISEAIAYAKSQQCNLIVFSELAVCGYPPEDIIAMHGFAEACENTIEQLAKHCNNISAIVGGIKKNESKLGKKFYNAAFFLHNGKVQNVVYKSLLPFYDVFDEPRYFQEEKQEDILILGDTKIALTICEDIWNIGREEKYYENEPMQKLALLQPDIIINIAASPFSFNHPDKRKQIIKANCLKYNLPLLYVNQVGANTELIFDGGTGFFNEKGQSIIKTKNFEEDIVVFDVKNKISEIDNTEQINKIAFIYDALVLGIKDFFRKQNFKKAVLGMSGGIDSALTLALACKALGRENVLAVMLPSVYSSEHSVSDSEQMVKTLGCQSQLISIEQTFGSALKTLENNFANTPSGLAEENLQSRIRGLLLMAISNKHGYILLNTSNKSEAATGYGTLYGDMCGALSVLGDVYKTEVYELAKFINSESEIIPQNIITKEPSAELRHNQKDSDSLPPYEILDAILYQLIENKATVQEIEALGFDKATVEKVFALLKKSEFKRYQMPPVLRVSEKAFGRGRRFPIVADY